MVQTKALRGEKFCIFIAETNMENMITALKNMPGIFDRAFELRKDPLLADIYEDITNLEKLQYIGPEMDKINLRNDISHWKGDFRKAFQVAKKRR
jgi:hypothetical protein